MAEDIASVRLAKLAVAFERAHAVYFPASAHEMGELGSKILAEEGVRYWISPGGDSITCAECRLTGNNPNDVQQHYCGFCHMFHDDFPLPPPKKAHDAREALALFESMRTDELLMLQRAHQADQAEATEPESIVFGAGRLALIAMVLKKRNATP